jgi:lipopolysaccharide transport protein LptA/LPS export ABC transporter protein LptC
MKRDLARTARQALLGLVVLVSLAVAWSLWHPRVPVAAPTPPPSPGAGTTVGDMSFLRFQDQSRRIEVKAREAVRQPGDIMLMKDVEAAMPFVNEGRSGTLKIRAQECQYQAGLERAAFKGKVELRTDDGFELDSETLKYWGDKQRAFTGDPVRFKHGRMSGTATGLEYRPDSGVELREQVRIRIDDPQGPPTEIESRTATGSREEHVFVFTGAVRAAQGERELRSESLRLDMNDAMDAVDKAVATGSVDLVTGPGGGLPGSTNAAASGGRKRLRGQRLDIVFRDKGVLQQAVATDAASLDIEPGPQETGERRRLTGQKLVFDFDEQGALAAVHVPPAAGTTRTRSGASRLAVLMAEPIKPADGMPRRVESESIDATLDPSTGAPKEALFKGAVQFTEPGRKAWASQAAYDDAAGSLVLTGDPKIVDQGEGSELRAQTIRIATRTHGITASGGVRHSIEKRSSTGGPRQGMFGGDQPTVFFCRDFEYDSESRTARYKENALARSGTDEVRAPLITIEDPGPGKRRMTASGGTTSVLHPRPSKSNPAGPLKADVKADAKADVKEPAPIDARSKEMVYEEAAGKVVYTGDVELRQGDILSKSPTATAFLTKDGDALDRVLAGEPVEVHQGQRRANGERGVYTPADETFVLTGEKVVLFDGDRKLGGRKLTFVSGSDRIRVDGREEERTEAVFKRKEPPKP